MDNNNAASGFNQWLTSKTTSQKDNKPNPQSKFSRFLWWFAIFLMAWWLVSFWMKPDQKIIDVAIDTNPVENTMAAVPVSNVDGALVAARVQGMRISNIELKNYVLDKKQDANAPVTLLSGDKEFAEIGLLANGTSAPTASTVWNTIPYDGMNIMSWKNSDKIEFKRAIIPNDYVITVRDEIKNNSKKDVSFAPYARIIRDGGPKKSVAVSTGAVAFVNSDIERNDWRDLEKKPHAYSTTNGFVGFQDQYWETVVSVGAPDQTIRMKQNGSQYQVDAGAMPVSVAAGKTVTIETQIFAGPREQKILNSAADMIPGINKTMDYGWFWFLSQPLLWALNALHDIVMNYGLAIILLTMALRLLMWPLTRKSYTSMAAMQKMQPEMAKIQKLYANDKVRQQMEMTKLYKTYKTSPMSGCLPMLLQIPIFFALYKALLISVPMRQAGFLWMSDLSVMDPFFILPLLMGATMWWQQTLQSASSGAAANPNDPMAQTQKIMKYMPILFTVMFAFMPAGLVLYWTVSNLFGIGQMYIIKRTMKK